MLKKSQTAPIASPDDALAIGIRALEYLAAEPDLMQRFLDLSGIGIHELRREAANLAFFAGLLDFMLDHEPTLEAFAAHAGRSPQDIAAARAVLSSSFESTPR